MTVSDPELYGQSIWVHTESELCVLMVASLLLLALLFSVLLISRLAEEDLLPSQESL